MQLSRGARIPPLKPTPLLFSLGFHGLVFLLFLLAASPWNSPPPAVPRTLRLEITPDKIRKAALQKPRRPQTSLEIKNNIQVTGIQENASAETTTVAQETSAGADESLYLMEVRRRITEQLHYPTWLQNSARRLMLRIEIRPSGAISSIQIAESSGSEELDDLAIRAVEHASPLPPLPQTKEMNLKILRVPIEFHSSP